MVTHELQLEVCALMVHGGMARLGLGRGPRERKRRVL